MMHRGAPVRYRKRQARASRWQPAVAIAFFLTLAYRPLSMSWPLRLSGSSAGIDGTWIFSAVRQGDNPSRRT